MDEVNAIAVRKLGVMCVPDFGADGALLHELVGEREECELACVEGVLEGAASDGVELAVGHAELEAERYMMLPDIVGAVEDGHAQDDELLFTYGEAHGELAGYPVVQKWAKGVGVVHDDAEHVFG